MKIKESNITFEFPDENRTIKFDEDTFYTKHFNKMPYSKGVDFISSAKDVLLFLEVKNCTGDEINNLWRIQPNNEKLNVSKTTTDVVGRDSLDIEMAQKVAMTIAAIVGAVSFDDRRGTAENLLKYKQEILTDKYAKDKKKWMIVLFLEGDFESQTRTKKMIMQSLQGSIKAKLSWLNCQVSVVDSSTYNERYFKIA